MTKFNPNPRNSMTERAEKQKKTKILLPKNEKEKGIRKKEKRKKKAIVEAIFISTAPGAPVRVELNR